MNARLVLCALLAVATIGLLVWAFTDQGASWMLAPESAPQTEPAAPISQPTNPPPPASNDTDPAEPDDVEAPPTLPEPASRSATPPPPQPKTRQKIESFPDDWFFRGDAPGRRHPMPQSLEGRPMPRLQVKNWIGEPTDLDDLRGKVVVIDFWATWCGPCVRSIPHNIQLVDKYRDEDLVFIGVHDSKKGFNQAPALAERLGINYPVGVDDAGISQRAWRLPFWPMYAVVDRQGIVRAAGLMPRYIEPVVRQLLEEGA